MRPTVALTKPPVRPSKLLAEVLVMAPHMHSAELGNLGMGGFNPVFGTFSNFGSHYSVAPTGFCSEVGHRFVTEHL